MELVRTTDDRWMVRPPTHCPNGHELGPGRVLVGHQACGNHDGGHMTWTCRECGSTVYRPATGSGCRVLHGPAPVRISTAQERVNSQD